MQSEDLINQVLEEIESFNIDDIPNIDLYMDQVTTYLNGKFNTSKRHDDDKLLTKTMINNYAKSRLLPPPEKKKYSKDHMIILILIFFFKNVISINDIQTIVTPLLKDYYNNDDIPNSLEDVTNAFLNHVQKSDLIEPLIKEFKNSQNIFGDLESSDRESIETIGLIATLSYDMYIRKRLIEKLIDSLPSSKEDTGKDKK
ncbi:DUF1836 domain-containing protein [Eubacterium ventriosum]|jgi:uncharacterized protein (UPF0305 family)|uniref:DUF1836 domain-containing protein n=1 Tax=Eubacterium ventriosum TaxID=39496 RepID=UPI00265DE540|nr:DUF1836 domain-containing protein [Eubacterium ventriosum]